MQVVARALALLALAEAGCADTSDADRAAWLASTLTLDRRDLILREPELVAGQYAKMARSPFAFLRGTQPQLARDLLESPELTSAGAAWAVLLVGDAHPENLGSYRAGDGRLWLDFNDFDAARHGPFQLDLWRLGQGFEVLLRGLPNLDDDTEARVLAGLARGYAGEVARAGQGEVLAVDGRTSRVVAALLGDADDGGSAREEMADYTRDGGTTLRRGVLEMPTDPGVIEEELRDPPARAAWIANALVREWPATLAGARSATATLAVLDLARHLGSGVSSYPLDRYYALVDDGGDRVILELKETRDPPLLPGLPLLPARQYPHAAARAVDAARRLQLYPDDDPRLGWIARGALALRVRDRTKFQRGFEVAAFTDAWAAGEWTTADAAAFAEIAGRLLGRAHGRGTTLYGEPAAPAILAAIGPDVDAFTVEATARFVALGERCRADYALFLELLETRGPLLGARP